MISESARMTTAAEARFRVQTPPPTRRVVKVIDLDAAGPREIAALVDEVPSTDLVVMLATAGTEPHGAAIVGEACSRARVMTTTLVARRGEDDEALARTLAQVRPWSLMVVVSGEDGYLEDLLNSFR